MEEDCLYCMLYPSYRIGLIFGDNFAERCEKHRLSPRETKIMSIYGRIIEAILFSHTAMICIHTFSPDDEIIACSPIGELGGRDNALFLKGIFASFSFSIALMVQNGRKSKLVLDLRNTDYRGEEEKIRERQIIMRNFILIMYCFGLVPIVFVASYVISNFVERKSSYKRALFCAVYFNVCFIYEYALCMWMLSFIYVGAFAIRERFNVLSGQLQRLFINCSKRDIHNLIGKHVELCDFINQVNDKWNEYMFLVYGSLLTLVCFFVYNTVFPELSPPLYLLMCFNTIFAITIAIVASLAASRFCVAAYDSFQEIRIMSALPLSITEKLKMLDFMKRFQENSIGASIGDCFILSKETPVEVYNALYTIFNMMLEIRNIIKGKSSHCIPRNASLPSYNTSSTD